MPNHLSQHGVQMVNFDLADIPQQAFTEISTATIRPESSQTRSQWNC